MTDIVEKLRGYDALHFTDEAADEITLLREQLAEIHKEAETNQKWAFLEYRQKAKYLEQELLSNQQLRNSIIEECADRFSETDSLWLEKDVKYAIRVLKWKK